MAKIHSVCYNLLQKRNKNIIHVSATFIDQIVLNIKLFSGTSLSMMNTLIFYI